MSEQVPPCVSAANNSGSRRPNIAWIFFEDLNSWMGCYGDRTVPTPNIDELAAKGIRFDRYYSTAGVCSPARSAIAFGCMQTSLGIHNHRSSRQRIPGEIIRVPEPYKTVYRLLRDSGYYVINDGCKNDFNFAWPIESGSKGADLQRKKLEGEGERVYGSSAYPTEDRDELIYDVNTETWVTFQPVWRERPDGKPLFMQFQFRGGKNSGRFSGGETRTDPAKVAVMPYYPDLPAIRREIAHHYDCVRQADEEAGRLLEMLKSDGLFENTVFFLFSDHGMKLYRHKQWLYEGGIRMPLIICGPGVEEGAVRSDLVSGTDISATTLALSGAEIPTWMEGRNMLAEDFKRDYVVSARDRCDFTIDRVRAVTTDRFKYIRNFMTDRPFMQSQYRDHFDSIQDARARYEAGGLDPEQSFPWSPARVAEELYDLQNDPHETSNLASSPCHLETLTEHREILRTWIQQTDDKGQYPETVTALKGALRQWGAKAVNPEFDRARSLALDGVKLRRKTTPTASCRG